MGTTTAAIVDIPQLEKTILQMAQDCLIVAERYRDKRLQGTATDEDAETFVDNSVALETLVKLAYDNDSGMTTETRMLLLGIESQEVQLMLPLREG